MSKSAVTLLVLGCLLGCSGLAAEREMSGREFYDLFLDARENSAQSFRLIRETEGSYYIEMRASPFHEKMLRVPKTHLRISCVDGAQVPCVIKEKMVVWVDN